MELPFALRHLRPAAFPHDRDEDLARRVATGVFERVADTSVPGAAVGVITRDGSRSVAVDGFAQVEPERVRMTRGTYFDLASLTKGLFTTSRILQLVDEGTIGLDQQLGELIPDLRQYDAGAPERRLTIRQCLTHQTFLPAVEPLYTYGLDPATLRAYILQRVWPSSPPVYSDINFMLLGIMLERLVGCTLGEQEVAPGLTFSPDREACAATERCPWRGRVLRGQVHDENAFALGGAAGHAGLFGTIDAVLDAALALLQEAEDPGSRLGQLLVRQAPSRTLGWEMPAPGWSGGEHCSPRTVGHSGFTGTGLWVDLGRGVAWSLLTNRIHPTRHVPRLIALDGPELGARLAAELNDSREA